MHFSSQEIEQPLRSLFSPKENNEGTELNGIVLHILYEMGQFYTVFAASSFFFPTSGVNAQIGHAHVNNTRQPF